MTGNWCLWGLFPFENIELFTENIELIENVKLFTKENKLILEEVVNKIKNQEKFSLNDLKIDQQLIERVYKFASI